MIPYEINYFATANSCYGRKNLLETNISHLKKLFIITDGYECLRHIILKHIRNTCINNGIHIESIRSSYSPDNYDGIILTEKNIGFINVTMVSPENNLAGAPFEIKYIHCMSENDSASISDELIYKYKKQYLLCYNKAYKKLTEAKTIHDEWENVYISCFNKRKANEYTRQFISNNIFRNNNSKPNDGYCRHRFLGCASHNGSVDFVNNITENISKRYFIKGRPGTGKSTFMRKINEAAVSSGFDTEVYHCGFDTESYDMVIIRALDICIFDSTAPHEYFPDRKNDTILDFYRNFVKPGTDERYNSTLTDIENRYKKNIASAVSYMKEANDIAIKANEHVLTNITENNYKECMTYVTNIINDI